MINKFSNKGMYIEHIINNSAKYYAEQKICLIKKKQLPFVFSNQKKSSGYILKSTTDYYGLYKGIYFDFEVKQTEKNYFYINNIKPHQLNHLKEVNFYGSLSFLILYFFTEDIIFIIKYIDLEKLMKKTKKIEIKYAYKYFYQAHIIFPGIIDFEKIIKKIKA
ncbi:MAG: Holliday junction resolvase RecU [Mycoplasmoidaceae bacterium]